MDPLYSVQVQNLTQGWTLTAAEGDEVDPAVTPVVLADPLTYAWDFVDDVLPAQLQAFTASVSVAARDADHVPETQVGDLVQLAVRLGSTGPMITCPYPMRVTTAAVTLTGKSKYPARLSMGLADMSSDWAARMLAAINEPDVNQRGRFAWRPRLAQVGNLSGLSVGCPDWWADGEGPAGNVNTAGTPFKLSQVTDQYSGTTQENLAALVNSHQPGAQTHVVTTVYGPHPTGYGYVGPDDWTTNEPPPFGFATWNPIAEPAGPLRAELVPASRRVSGALGLPLMFAEESGRIVVVPRVMSGSSLTAIAVDADWCNVPTTARRSRESAVNAVNIIGQGRTQSTDDSGVATYANVDSAYVVQGDLSRGVVTRDVATQLYTGPIGFSDAYYGPAALEPPIVGSLFLADSSALDAPWAYDSVTVLSSLIPDAHLSDLLPVIAPHVPGETGGDGRLVRQITVYGLGRDLRFGGDPATGFITGGTMTISDGEIAWDLAMTPGRPQWTDFLPAPITVGQFDAAFGTSLVSALGRAQIGDLSYVNPPEGP